MNIFQLSFADMGKPKREEVTPKPDKKKVILLDLNYTLVGNSPLKRQQRCSYREKILSETYREWLIDLVSPHHVILVTVRKRYYEQETLKRIEDTTGWKPDQWYFNRTQSYDGAIVKLAYLKDHIYPEHGKKADYLAIESALSTTRMYHKQGIPTCKVAKGSTWSQLPNPPKPTLR